MKTSSAKSKGRALQKLVRDMLLLYNPELTLDDVRSAPSGTNGPDLMLSAYAQGLIPYDIECKNQETWKVLEWWAQLENRHKDGSIPALVMKKNRTNPLVVMDLEDWVSLNRKVWRDKHD